MNRLRVLTVLATVAAVLAASQWCLAAPVGGLFPDPDGLTLTSSGGGVYDYALVTSPGGTFFAQLQ